ncbi:hypothetical protein LIER_39666 [Lithospermum erythrorhizon]|uniref:Uncharacterized protein n=1 Tax=Lithospermum erythrorhizon TaxID=34254 RepID=A0AAV3QLB4_LITER
MLKALKLSANKLTSSSVSSILSNLTQLEIIDLSDNPLYEMPPELFELSSLQRINLQQTQLYGPIPKSFSNLVNLKYLKLASNNLSGPIIQKRTFSNLVNLEYLSLASNNFTGPIEIDALYNLVNLTSLDLSSNNFGTTLDVKFLSRLKSLRILDLSFSSLTLINEDNITLPMISIVSLRLGSCNISDLDILRSIVVQRDVHLPNNKIHGQLPEWIWSKWSNVIELDLSNNFLTHIGNKIPLQRLIGLELRSNLLNGQLPILPQSITSLDLSDNQFHGEIKPSICELELYVLLDLSNNSLNGALPHCIGMMGLQVLDLHMNNLQGNIPNTFPMNSGLMSLNLRGNRFEGEVPHSLSNCSNLKFLDLSENNLNDTFPIWLGNLPNLRVLSLKSNKLYGPISFPPHASADAFSHVQILDLSYNQLNGSLPFSLFRRLRQMMSVDETILGYFGDEYPIYEVNDYHDSMAMVLNGNIMQLERIQSSRTGIDLSSNHFEGEIPSSIGGLIAIQQLNLSQNNFTGQLPPQIGNLSNLHSLDLSSNQLDGHIPDKFAALGFLAVMNLSYNHLTGPIPSGTQLQSFSNASYMGNDGLCGFPLSKSCGNHESPQHGFPDEEDDREFFDGFTWQSVVVGYCVGICIGLVIGSLMFFIEKPKWLIRIVQEEAYRMILKYKARNGIRLT